MFGFVQQRGKHSSLHVTDSMLAMSASSYLPCWKSSSTRELILPWPKVALHVCHRVRACKQSIFGEQPVCSNLSPHSMLWVCAALNTVQGFDKRTMLPGNSALHIAQKTQDLYEETCYVCFYSVTAYARAFHSLCVERRQNS